MTDLAFTPDGQELVSSSDDKTIRIRDWQSGVTLRTIRAISVTAMPTLMSVRPAWMHAAIALTPKIIPARAIVPNPMDRLA
ncbi:hypothetical protein NKI36_20120 [Mesorhizobium caraganae]|uniref:Anaphase-promoting complex subunit 4 WD40 domain-containing protein n=1 Tax=Mesorhizobium caraganae TaxID=483206 RepID=A0ABV1Z3I6_9HYPH